jgi:hypothetical protein
MTITEQIHHALPCAPATVWTPAIQADGQVPDGPWVAEPAGDVLNGLCHHTAHIAIAALELRYRQHARAEDRIRAARATGRRNLPFHHAANNQVWLEVVQIALELLAWMTMLALTGPARRWEVKRLPLRLLSAAAQLLITGRRRILRLARYRPWTRLIIDALPTSRLCPTPADLHLPGPYQQHSRPEPWNPAPARRDSRAASVPRH